jgi:cytoskeletal protein CcmA (bactofilin family)
LFSVVGDAGNVARCRRSKNRTSSAIFGRLTPSGGTSIVAGVLNKLFPQKSGETPRAEDAGRGASPLDSHALELKTTTPKNSVMADTPTKNNLSNDVEIKGSIKFANEFVFDGKLEGEITSVDGVLTAGENADVRGEVKSKTVIVKGKVHGNITVQERCELHARSQLIGDLKATRLVIEEGATFVGKSEVTPNKGALKDVGQPTPQPAHQTPQQQPQKIGAPR